MGSTCSILNDTEHDIWITHGVNWTVLIASVVGVVGVLTAGIGLAVLGAIVGVGGALAGGGVFIMAEEGIIIGTTATTIAGLTATQWTLAGIVTSLSGAALSETLNITRAEGRENPAGSQRFSGNFTLCRQDELRPSNALSTHQSKNEKLSSICFKSWPKTLV